MCWPGSGHGRFFYTHPKSGRSQWELPEPDNKDDSGDNIVVEMPPAPCSMTVERVPSITDQIAAVEPEPDRVASPAEKGEEAWNNPPVPGEEEPAACCAAPPSLLLSLPRADVMAEPMPCSAQSEPIMEEPRAFPSAEEELQPTPPPPKRKKTKVSAGLALRKKNIPSLLQKWERIKEEQMLEDSSS